MSHGSPVALELHVRHFGSAKGGLQVRDGGLVPGLTYRAHGLSTAVSSLKICSKL